MRWDHSDRFRWSPTLFYKQITDIVQRQADASYLVPVKTVADLARPTAKIPNASSNAVEAMEDDEEG